MEKRIKELKKLVYQHMIGKYGIEDRLKKHDEECAEYCKAYKEWQESGDDMKVIPLLDELADSYITGDQCVRAIAASDRHILYKLTRLAARENLID